ncbi:MAG: hypothetical protein KF770_06575 [Anaerolineae bacterium]|nr:hypothetical protein [Anaerolineae bacterium]
MAWYRVRPLPIGALRESVTAVQIIYPLSFPSTALLFIVMIDFWRDFWLT